MRKHDIANLSDTWHGPIDDIDLVDTLLGNEHASAWAEDATALELAIAVQTDPDPALVEKLRNAYTNLAWCAQEAISEALEKRLDMVTGFRRAHDARQAEREAQRAQTAARVAAMSPDERAQYEATIGKLAQSSR